MGYESTSTIIKAGECLLFVMLEVAVTGQLGIDQYNNFAKIIRRHNVGRFSPNYMYIHWYT